MGAQIIENKKYKQEEMDVIHRKRAAQQKINDSMLGTLGKYKKKEEDRKRKECEDMTAWLESEKQRRDEEERELKIEYARKCEAAKKNLKEHQEYKAEQKR